MYFAWYFSFSFLPVELELEELEELLFEAEDDPEEPEELAELAVRTVQDTKRSNIVFTIR